jgi:hypothetical protein
MPINHYTHDLFGREVDGLYWLLLEESFEDCARRYRAGGDERAASIADRLAETADDVPAQLMQEFQDLWNVMLYPDGQSPAELTGDEMIESIAYGYSPDNATSFVSEFIRRATGAPAQGTSQGAQEYDVFELPARRRGPREPKPRKREGARDE